MAKKTTQAQKIRDYAAKRPNATIADIAHSMGIRYQTVYAVLKVQAQAKENKKQKWKVLHMSTSNKSINPIMVDLTQHADGTITEKVTDIPKEWVTADNVNHPAHYKVGGIETIDFIEAKGFGYNLGNVIKYLSRADSKGKREEDLLKARWYLNREIAKFTKE